MDDELLEILKSIKNGDSSMTAPIEKLICLVEKQCELIDIYEVQIGKYCKYNNRMFYMIIFHISFILIVIAMLFLVK